MAMSADIFQSTLPIQGETFCFLLPSSETVISIHSPYTGRDGTSAYTAICLSVISIHSPYTGRDCSCCMCVRLCGHFNPLSLYRERHWQAGVDGYEDCISIHSPYTGRDGPQICRRTINSISIHSPYTGRDTTISDTMRIEMYFNPLSLYRERRSLSSITSSSATFQSTLPIQGETKRTGTG